MPTVQEKEIAELCMRFAARRLPVGREELAFLVQKTFGSSKFTSGKLERKRLAYFCKHNKLSFSKPSKQAAERFASTNVEVLTSHIASLGTVLNDLKMTPRVYLTWTTVECLW
eukprot:IDg12823t1